MIRKLFFPLLLLVSISISQNLPKSNATLNVLFVVDGLRPDMINQEETPTLFKLKTEGAFFENSHAVLPTVTRVNSAAIASAAYPEKTDIVSNSMFVAAVSPNSAFSTGDYLNLVRLNEVSGGRLIQVPTAAERLTKAGKKIVAISSGSTGSAFLLNHKAKDGVGVLINGYFDPGKRVAFPDSVNERVLEKFGPAPDLSGLANYNEKVNWTTRVLTDYVLLELKPDVVFCWITEPDHTQHSGGIGSPQTIETVRNSDAAINSVLQRLESLGVLENTNIFVVSDHGFSTYKESVNMTGALVEAGLKKSADSDDLMLASSGQSVLIHVKNRDAEKIKEIVAFLQKQEWAGVLFTAASLRSPDRSLGWVDGTFSLELLHQPSEGRGADILLTFPWSSEANGFGYRGFDNSISSRTGPRNGTDAGHGGISPWAIRNTMIAWGADIKPRVHNRVPGCSIDFTATILALNGVPFDDDIQGRVVSEILKGGPDFEQVPWETRMITRTTVNGNIYAQVSSVGKYWYVDKCWRE